MDPSALERQIHAITRPDKSLLTYYLLIAIAIPPLFPVLGPFLYFRYHTMRYSFREDGISMSWGILFRREVIVNYSRIQDIHLRSNVLERWLGLARILVQTASASRSAEMTIEGIKEFEALRDYLYSKTRGVKDAPPLSSQTSATRVAAPSAANEDLTTTLLAVADELRGVRMALEKRNVPTEDTRHV